MPIYEAFPNFYPAAMVCFPNMTSYTLYGYFRSSCSARLRIALNVKGLSYDLIPINLLKGEQKSEEYRKLNPSASTPCLIRQQGPEKFFITQSVAALEYLEEAHSDRPALLPPKDNLEARANVRSLVNILCSDVQPVTNLRILKRVKGIGGSPDEWTRELLVEGLTAYEAIVAKTSGLYSVGDELTLADVCLVPDMWKAERYGVDMSAFPTIARIYDRLKSHDSVVKAHWQNQPDTPENLRVQ